MDPIVSPTPLSDCYLITFSFTYKISLLWNREKDVEGTWNKTKATEQHAQNSDRRACLYCVCVSCSHPKTQAVTGTPSSPLLVGPVQGLPAIPRMWPLRPHHPFAPWGCSAHSLFQTLCPCLPGSWPASKSPRLWSCHHPTPTLRLALLDRNNIHVADGRTELLIYTFSAYHQRSLALSWGYKRGKLSPRLHRGYF